MACLCLAFSGTLAIYDLSNHTLPVLRSNVSLSGAARGVAGRGSICLCRTIWIRRFRHVVDISNGMPRIINTLSDFSALENRSPGRICICAESNGGTVSVLILRNPVLPRLVGSVSVEVKDFRLGYRAVQGRYAYVTSFGDGSARGYRYFLRDISAVVSSLSVGDGPNDVVVSGRYAYVTNV